MTTAFPLCHNRWKTLFRAAFLETNKSLLQQRVSEAAEAVRARGREIFSGSGRRMEPLVIREATMPSSVVHPRKPFRLIHTALIATLTLLLSGWTCSALFLSCHGVGQQPQITSLSPDTIPSNANSVLLTVDGSGFTPQSEIMWNGNSLQTTFLDSHRLQTTITQQTFDSFGGSAGSSVQISVRSQGSVTDLGCPIDGNSAALVLVIN